MKICKDCGVETYGAAIRCIKCREVLRKETQRLNKVKFQYHKRPEAKYKVYMAGAGRRNLSFELTFDDFMLIWDKPCHYCGTAIHGIGIDRKNNKIGYTLNNVVSCCTKCNFMKRNISYNAFIMHCIKISNNFLF